MRGTVLMFGCREQSGHYLHHPMEWRTQPESKTPWGLSLDGGLCPDQKGNKCQTGRTAFHQKDGWTAISFWDQSIDSRPASNTTFLVQGLVAEQELLAMARDQWPEVFSRRGFPLRRQEGAEPQP